MSEAAPVKILLLGDATVGKSQLLVRFAEERFHPNCIVSIGVDTRYKTVACRERSIKVQVWDAAGKEEFRTLISSAYYQKAHGALIVYDITNEGSFQNIAYWMQQIAAKNSSNIPIIAIGNKTDLVDRHMASLRIPPEDEKNLSQKLGIPFLSVSAKTGDGVEDAFGAIVEQAVLHAYGDEPFGEPLPTSSSRCACACGWLQGRQSVTVTPLPVLPCPNSAVGPFGNGMKSSSGQDIKQTPVVDKVEIAVEEVEICESEKSPLANRSTSSRIDALKDSPSKIAGLDEASEIPPWNHMKECEKDLSRKSGGPHDRILATRGQHDAVVVNNPCNLFSALIRAFCECEVR